jgi:hypothetical protein
MAELADIFAALGPAATPILGFLNAKEAMSLLALSKDTDMEVARRTIAYQRRYGFPQPSYTERPDGSFTLRSSTETRAFRALKPWQHLCFKKENISRSLSGTPWAKAGDWRGVVKVCGNHIGQPVLFYGTVEDITRIARDSAPYRVARATRLKAEAEAKAKEAKAKEAAAKAKEAEATAAIAARKEKFTIRAPPPPTVNPWFARAKSKTT